MGVVLFEEDSGVQSVFWLRVFFTQYSVNKILKLLFTVFSSSIYTCGRLRFLRFFFFLVDYVVPFSFVL